MYSSGSIIWQFLGKSFHYFSSRVLLSLIEVVILDVRFTQKPHFEENHQRIIHIISNLIHQKNNSAKFFSSDLVVAEMKMFPKKCLVDQKLLRDNFITPTLSNRYDGAVRAPVNDLTKKSLQSSNLSLIAVNKKITSAYTHPKSIPTFIWCQGSLIMTATDPQYYRHANFLLSYKKNILKF